MEPQIKCDAGKYSGVGGSGIGVSGTIGLAPHKFTQPPIVVCQIMRTNHDASNARHVYVYTSNVARDYFHYTVKGDRKPGDQIHWIAIGT